MQLFNITDIFNNIVTMSPATLEALHDELRKNYKKLRKDLDVDNLRVLRNRMNTIVEWNSKKLTHKEQQKLQKIQTLIHEIDETILEIETAQKEAIELVDLEKKFKKKYKPLTGLSKDKKKTHVLIAMKKSEISYEEEILELQIELVKLQKYIQESWKKVLIIFEGRDAAGKWGNIKRFMESLNPRYARVVALMKPSDTEKWQWYFQRYISHLPNAWEMVFFDRSWYNRAGVEPVMGFVGKKDYEKFMDDVPALEKMLVQSGIKIIKFYFSVSKDVQAARFHERRTNPLKQYKLSPIDQFSQKLWDRYTIAEYHNFSRTHSDHAPWTIINSDDKEASRINAFKYLLNQFDYPDKAPREKLEIDPSIVYTGREKVKKLEREVDKSKSLFE
jgi:polyphosphate kinase 2